jgi:predicted dehydrogenase
MSDRKRYVLAGTGGRGIGMFGKPLTTDFSDTAELVGLFDHNSARVTAAQSMLKKTVPGFTDFPAMMAEVDPDCVIVCTKDNTHAQYINAALEAGKRVYSEKPLCTTAEQCKEISAVAAASSGECFVTHNLRYAPSTNLVKDMLVEGRIGKLLSIEFRETLDRNHGADYFRRWHGKKVNSGGLLIHKASHHFDLLNWWADSKPNVVSARGGTIFYGSAGSFRGTNCRTCPHTEACKFYIDLNDDELARQIYISAEGEDNYLRDGCVFDESIDIEDQASVLYNYDSGVRVVYSLIAYAHYEGMLIVLEGTEGRIEYEVMFTETAIGNSVIPGLHKFSGEHLRCYRIGEGCEEIEIPVVEGAHMGCDTGLQNEFFAQPWSEPRSSRMATLDEAIQAVVIGAAANESIANGGTPIAAQSLL